MAKVWTLVIAPLIRESDSRPAALYNLGRAADWHEQRYQ